MHAVDAAIARLAARQKELVSRGALLNEAVTRSAIPHRLRRGDLRQIHPGVYTTAHAPLICGAARARGRRVEVRYGPPRERRYRDLWIVTLADDDRCRAFEELPFWPPGSAGEYAAGPGAD